jgi:hypothetical protein
MSKFNWTKEKVATVAKKFSTLSMFQHNAKGAYNAAIENNWLTEVTTHMKPNRQKWNKERIIELAKKFSTIADFRLNEPSAYTTALSNRWIKEASEHMIPLNIQWSDQMIIDEAKKYKTRTEFEVKSPSACTIARGRKLMDLACAHMERVGNYTKRLVYVYEFPDNTAYIGLTYNKSRRHNDHTTKIKSPVYRKKIELKVEPLMKIISDSYIDAEAARILEEQTLLSYKSKGWFILNSIKAGGLGGTKTAGERLYQDKNACQLEALKYSTKKDFREGNVYAYRRASDLQCLDEVCSHMKSRSLSFEECSLEAKKYKNISDFLANSKRYYHRAHRMDWIDKICSHMNRYKKWTPKLVANEAKKYSTRGKFATNARTAYAYASLNKLLDIVCKHMKPVHIKWTEGMVSNEALKYKTHKDFRLNSPKAYEAAKNNGWFEKVTSHLKYEKKS